MLRIPSVTAFLDPANGYKPTDAERRLIAACQEGESCILSDKRPTEPTAANTIRAELIRLLILGGTPDCGLHDSGVMLHGGWITGKLDLRFATGRGKLTLNACHFEQEPFLEHARLDQLSVQGSKLPGLWAPNLEVKGDMDLCRAEVTGPTMLGGAQIGGQLACEGATLDGKGGEALNGQGMTLGGGLFLNAATAKGCIGVAGSQIGGQLSCEGATLDGKEAEALNGQGMTVDQDLVLSEAKAEGCIDLGGSKIGGQLACVEATLDGKDGEALNGQGMTVGDGLFLREAKVTGCIALNSARINGQLSCEKARLDGNGAAALSGQNMRVDGGF